MDLVALGFEVVFEGALIAVPTLLLVTFVAFVRMNKDVRRARMFIMADRVKRFLGAFTLGFLAIAADSVFAVAGITPPLAVSGAAIVLFLASMVYGSLEIFLVVRPPRSGPALLRKAIALQGKSHARVAPSAGDSPEGESHAAR